MSDALQKAIQAVLDGECKMKVVEVVPIAHGDAPDEVVICVTHACDWDESEAIPCFDARRVADAVTAGWDAAIREAANLIESYEVGA